MMLWDSDAPGEPLWTHKEERPYPISALTFHPNGGELAMASYDRRTDVWDTKTGERRHRLANTVRSTVLCAAFGGRDHRILATAGEDKTIHVWDVATERELLGLRGHTGEVGCLAFSPDGLRLASASKDGTIRVWDGTPLRDDEGEEAQTFWNHESEIWSLAVRPDDGGMIVSGGFRTPATLWDAGTGDVSARIPAQATVFCVAWSPDGQRFAAAGGWEGGFGVKVVDLQTPTGNFELPRSTTEYFAVAFHPLDGRYLITGQKDGTIRLWDLQTKRDLGTIGSHRKAIRGSRSARIAVSWPLRVRTGQSSSGMRSSRTSNI